ncbi:MAG: T9SS type A sorting domain-containing protein [Bacteroidia bacterium]|nr:T9SS type A sorting domain-containing protein [Bacteroidia bacterium]
MKFVDSSVGIDYKNTLNDILIHPNPTEKVLYFSVLCNVTISTTNGQVIIDRKNATSLDISDLSTGIYLLTATDNNNRILQRSKIVKK